jgi:hypothetical protein
MKYKTKNGKVRRRSRTASEELLQSYRNGEDGQDKDKGHTYVGAGVGSRKAILNECRIRNFRRIHPGRDSANAQPCIIIWIFAYWE